MNIVERWTVMVLLPLTGSIRISKVSFVASAVVASGIATVVYIALTASRTSVLAISVPSL